MRGAMLGMCVAVVLGPVAVAEPLTTTITYQGVLEQDGSRVNGEWDIRFYLYDQAVGGSLVELVEVNSIQIDDGLFTALVPLAEDTANGRRLWAELEAKLAADNTWESLAGRQELTAAPGAIALQLPLAQASGVVEPFAIATDTTAASASAIKGVIDNPSAGIYSAAVRGEHRGTTVNGIGVFGTHAGAGWGVYGDSIGGVGVLGHSNDFAGVYGIQGTSLASPPIAGVLGDSPLGFGVAGRSQTSPGVVGISESGDGVYGTSSSGDGVVGVANAPAGSGVRGQLGPNQPDPPVFLQAAVFGQAVDDGVPTPLPSPAIVGVQGVIPETATLYQGAIRGINFEGLRGVVGQADIGGNGVFGINHIDGVVGFEHRSAGVFGYSQTAPGVIGETNTSAGSAVGVWGIQRHETGGSFSAGVRGSNFSTTGNGVGVYGYQAGNGFGVYGTVADQVSGYAGWFNGRVHVAGALSKSSGSFLIDHPLDPENKVLRHSFVESPDMMNVYNGNATLDGEGRAVVVMPDYFGALNQDFRYQLTAIGAPGPDLHIAEEMEHNRFVIAGGVPGMRVSWQVTGIRHDAYAEANRIVVEEYKREEDRGRYLTPEAFGLPREMAVGQIAAEESP